MVASQTPKKKRVVRRPPKFWTSPCVTVTRPKPNIVIDTEHVMSSCRTGGKLKLTPNVRAELPQEEIGGNFEKNIRNEATIAFSTC